MLTHPEQPRDRNGAGIEYHDTPVAPPRRRVDWNAIAALMATCTAIAALVTAVAVLSYVHTAVRQSPPAAAVGMGASLDSFWRLREEWNSDDMGTLRSNAAAALLDHQPDEDVDDVLFFFDEMAFLWQRGALDEQLIWYEFYWPMANYWTASVDRVRELRGDDPTRLAALDSLMQQLVKIEVQQRNKSLADALPNATQNRDFLNSEVDDDPCMEDEDEDGVRRMPT